MYFFQTTGATGVVSKALEDTVAVLAAPERLKKGPGSPGSGSGPGDGCTDSATRPLNPHGPADSFMIARAKALNRCYLLRTLK